VFIFLEQILDQLILAPDEILRKKNTAVEQFPKSRWLSLEIFKGNITEGARISAEVEGQQIAFNSIETD